MEKNVGAVDAVIRIILALLVAVLYLTHAISGKIAIVLGIIAVVLLVTGLLRWCCIYSILGISTKEKNQQQKDQQQQ